MNRLGNVLARLGLSALVGGMLFFGAVMAPLVFTRLPPELAGPFIRAAFPRYYLFVTVSALVAGLGFSLRRAAVHAGVMALLAVLTLWLWFGLLPDLNAMREAGDTAGFARGHRLSVWLNAVELLAALVILIGVGNPGSRITSGPD